MKKQIKTWSYLLGIASTILIVGGCQESLNEDLRPKNKILKTEVKRILLSQEEIEKRKGLKAVAGSLVKLLDNETELISLIEESVRLEYEGQNRILLSELIMPNKKSILKDLGLKVNDKIGSSFANAKHNGRTLLDFINENDIDIGLIWTTILQTIALPSPTPTG